MGDERGRGDEDAVGAPASRFLYQRRRVTGLGVDDDVGPKAFGVRELAVRAQVDPNTIRRAARKEHVRGMAGRRALAVLIAEGYLPPQEELPLKEGAER